MPGQVQKYRGRSQRIAAIRPTPPALLSRCGRNFLSYSAQGSVMLDTDSCDIYHVSALSYAIVCAALAPDSCHPGQRVPAV